MAKNGPGRWQECLWKLETRYRLLMAVVLVQALSFGAIYFVSCSAAAIGQGAAVRQGAAVGQGHDAGGGASGNDQPRIAQYETLRVRRIEFLGESGQATVIVSAVGDGSRGGALQLQEPGKAAPALVLLVGLNGNTGVAAGDMDTARKGSYAFFGIDSQQAPHLSLTGPGGRPEIVMAVNGDVPQLTFVDAQGEQRIRAGIQDGRPSIWLGSSSGGSAAIEGGPEQFGLVARDIGGTARLYAGLRNDVSMLNLYDAAGKPVIEMAAPPQGLPTFNIKKK